MKEFVWDTSALINLKEPNADGYSPANSFMKDFSEGWLEGPYLNIFPANAVFELSATISRKHREGKNVLREFYILNANSMIYEISKELILKSSELVTMDGFNKLRGGDLIFASIAAIENATLITLDSDYQVVADKIKVIDLKESLNKANYRDIFEQE